MMQYCNCQTPDTYSEITLSQRNAPVKLTPTQSGNTPTENSSEHNVTQNINGTTQTYISSSSVSCTPLSSRQTDTKVRHP